LTGYTFGGFFALFLLPKTSQTRSKLGELVLQRFALNLKTRVFLKALLCKDFKNAFGVRFIENCCRVIILLAIA
jgi:hypothetical protein